MGGAAGKVADADGTFLQNRTAPAVRPTGWEGSVRSRQLVITMAAATLISAIQVCGDEPEDAAIAGKRLAPDAATRVTYADVVSPPAEPEPWIHPSMPEAIRGKIERAFEIAGQRLRQRPECAELFSPFGVDGAELLARSLYLPAGPQRQTTRCRHAFAVTEIGGPTTWVCRKVTAHSDERVAVALIHEALHHAGLCEYPHDRTAMKSGEINNLVMESCGLP
jgi:hypothetical protein